MVITIIIIVILTIMKAYPLTRFVGRVDNYDGNNLNSGGASGHANIGVTHQQEVVKGMDI